MMHTNKYRILTVSLILLTVVGFSVSAYPLRAWNHQANPAFLGAGNRPYFETGLSASPGFQNSYFTTGKIFNPVLLIDFDDIYDSLNDKGYRIGGAVGAEVHSTAHVMGIGAGIYSNTDTLFRVSIPKGLFGKISEGIKIGTEYNESGEAFVQSFAEYGAYAGYRRPPFIFGLKMGKFVPLAYTKDGEATYTFLANENGLIEATAQVNAELYSAFNLEFAEEITEEEIMNALTGPDGGIKIDLGVVYNPDGEKPLWGASLVNIPLAAANTEYGWAYSLSTDGTAENILDTAINDEDMEFYDYTDPESDFVDIGGHEIRMPFTIGGFYLYDGLPLIDVIPYGEMVFGSPFRLNTGVTVEGSRFPFSMLSLGLAYDDLAWKSSMGLRINLRIIEIETRISLSSPEMLGMFSARGFSFNLYAALGF